MIIEDGAGTGQTVSVKNNKLQVSAVVSSQEHYANHNQGEGFNLVFSATPTGAGDCFLYIKNENPDLALSIEGFWLKDASNEYIEIKLNDIGTPIGGTDIVPVNVNTASARNALGTFQNGADITGLSGGDTIHKIYHASSNESIYRNFNMDVVLGAGGVLTMYAGTGTTAIEGVIVFNYHGTNN
jgi:hypothetical protein